MKAPSVYLTPRRTRTMITRLMRALQEALLPRWQRRLPSILLEADSLDPEMSAYEAYPEGYRKGYWDAMVDMAESGLLRVPPPIPAEPRAFPVAWASEEVH